MPINLEFARAERLPDTDHYKGGYCFDVLRDGTKIAQWRPIQVAKGYTLVDLSGRVVRAPYFRTTGERGDLDAPWHWHDVECKAQSEFAEQITKELDYIPTLEQIAQRDADEAAKVAERAAKAEDEARVERVKEAGPDLLSVVRYALSVELARPQSQQEPQLIGMAKAVIAAATGQGKGNRDGLRLE